MSNEVYPPIELVVLDMAGTTVRDDGAVQSAFITAAQQVDLARDDVDLDRMTRYVVQTMGQSKIDVFTHLSGGDHRLARRATAAFEKAYAQQVTEGGCSPLTGAVETFARLREAGVAIALTTGFSRATADLILDALGWRKLIDICVTPAEAGRGRPHPDLPLTALLRLEASSVQTMAVAGDTASDMRSGRRAGARVVAGVLTGAHDTDQLREAGATHLLDSVIDLPDVVLTSKSHAPW